MDHNLDNSLNLESAIGVDFSEPENEVLQCSEQMMEFEDQSLLMETGNEEIIVSDLIDDQFSNTFEHFTSEEICETEMEDHLDGIEPNQAVPEINEGVNITEISTLESNNEEMEVQQVELEQVSKTYVVTSAPSLIKIQKPAIREAASLPWQIPIAPKPVQLKASFPGGKQLTLAPKPVKPKPISTNIKKIPLSALMQANKSGQTVLAQIGKQLVVVPSGSQKLKIVQNSGGSFVKSDGEQQSQLIRTSSMGKNTKPVLAKVIVQGDGPAVLKMIPSGAQQPGKVVVQSKGGTTSNLVPIQSKGKQIISEVTQKLVPVNPGSKKVLIPANPQTMMIKSVTSKPAQARTTQSNVINVTSGPPQTRLHQVHLPGKGVQYIRLVTKPPAKTDQVDNDGVVRTTADPTKKNYVITDGKGNIVQMVNKDGTGQLVFNGRTNRAIPSKKLVKIAPITQKMVQLRPPQSLLAPSPPQENNNEEELENEENIEEDSKEALHELLRKQEEAQEMEEKERTPRYLFEEFENAMDKEQEAALKKMIDEELQHQKQELSSRPRKPCNCTKSQCLKLYCECFANGEFCKQCNCNNCHNNLEHEDVRRSAIMGCLDRNPDAFRPKIGKATSTNGPMAIRRHNKGCNCKRSGCLKNYCECYEAKIACSANCKCVGCRNVEDGGRRPSAPLPVHSLTPLLPGKQPCTLMTSKVIEAACQCLLAAASPDANAEEPADSVISVLTEFARCLQEIIASAQQPTMNDSLL